MKFTFGIITNASNGINNYLPRVVDSILKENIPEYQIIIVGSEKELKKYFNNIDIIDFNENIKPAWITRKKNLITQYAKYDNIVYMHDYIGLIPGWYSGWLKFGENYHACMNKMVDCNNIRFRDWTIWPLDNPAREMINRLGLGNHLLLPYEETRFSKYQYFSGAYWVGKKDVMKEFTLNENLCWAQGEDVEWSLRIREKYNFSINQNSTVKVLKPHKDRAFNELTPQQYQQILQYTGLQ